MPACLLLSAVAGCASQSERQDPQQPKAAIPSPSPPENVDTGAASTTPASQSTNPAPPQETPCAQLRCTSYPTAAAALLAAVPQDVSVVGFGEAHTPSDYSGRTTARRFAEDLLPALAPRSRRLLVELLAPPSGCEKPRQEVQAESDVITEGQAEQNQDDYLALGHAARKLGVVPDILRPTCDEMRAIAASEVRVLAIMETIAHLSVNTTERWLTEPQAERPLVLLYGGALHNDVAPREHLESWSYGARLSARTEGRYVEVDLVVPELMQDTESWQKFLWYSAVRSLPEDHGATLVHVSDHSFALVFPRSPR